MLTFKIRLIGTSRDLNDKSIILRYNNLTDSEELQSEVSTRYLQNLAEIFVKYNVHNQLGVHLIHSHAKVAAGHVMLGHKFTDPSGCWSRPTTMEDVNLAEVHGHIFKLIDDDRFVAYEYVEGKASDLSNISTGFFKELAGYVRANGLGEIVGLQIRGQAAENMVEFDFGDCGTVMLKAQETRHETPFRNSSSDNEIILLI